MLGMAVGTGNIWRFPRIAASNGGGTFLVAWVCFLLLWSVPLLILEFGMGKGMRKGPVGAFAKLLGPKFGWMGRMGRMDRDRDHVLLQCGHGLDDPVLLGVSNPRDPQRRAGRLLDVVRGFTLGSPHACDRHEPGRVRRVEGREGHRNGGALS